MEWTIYSIGDGLFLAKVLQGVAMLFNSGLTQGAFALAVLLGVLYQGFKGTSVAKGLDMAQIFVVFIMYSLFFIPKTNVCVIDCKTWRSETVGHMPLGVAVVGSVVSTVGHKFAQSFAVAFGEAQDTERAFLDPLKIVSKLRTDISYISRLSDIDAKAGGNFAKSWKNYFLECTNVGVDLGLLKVANLLESPDPTNAALFSSKVYGTAINVSGTEELLDCSSAHDKLVAYSKGPYMEKFLASLEEKTMDHGLPLTDTNASINAALNSLGLLDTAVSDYVLATVLLPIYREAIEGKYLDTGAFAQALMLREARLARNTKLSAEESIFLKNMRPLLSFLEALIYSITPFMPLVLGLGFIGVSMLGRYILVLLWCAVLEPLMYVVNFFTLLSARGAMQNLSIPYQSMSGFRELLDITEDYIALGGLLMTSVPIIAGVVVYGSGHALASILSSAQMGGALKTTTVLPELSSNTPVTSGSPLFEKSLASGVVRDGGHNMVADFSLSRGYEEVSSRAQSKATSAMSAFSTSLANSTQSVFGTNVTHSTLERIGQAVASSKAQSSGVVTSLSKNIAESMGLNLSQENALRGAVSSVLSGGGLDIGLLSSLTLSNGQGVSQGEAVSRLSAKLNNVAQDKSLRAQFTQSVTQDVAQGVSTGFTESKSKSVNKTLAQSAEQAVSAQETLAKLQSSKASLGAMFNIDGASMAKLAANNEFLFSKIGHYVASSDTMLARTQELNKVLNQYLPDGKQAYMAAAFTAMLEQEPTVAYSFMTEAVNNQAPSTKNANIGDKAVRKH